MSDLEYWKGELGKASSRQEAVGVLAKYVQEVRPAEVFGDDLFRRLNACISRNMGSSYHTLMALSQATRYSGNIVDRAWKG